MSGLDVQYTQRNFGSAVISLYFVPIKWKIPRTGTRDGPHFSKCVGLYQGSRSPSEHCMPHDKLGGRGLVNCTE
jgi:hypothetical protein